MKSKHVAAILIAALSAHASAFAQTDVPGAEANSDTAEPTEKQPETGEPAPEEQPTIDGAETGVDVPQPKTTSFPDPPEAEKSSPQATLDAPTKSPVKNVVPTAPSDPVAVARSFSFNPHDSDIRVKPVAEIGALFVLWHRYQGGSDGTNFNLRRDAGQASAFLSWRVSAEVELFQRHQLILLYQPIDLRTRATLSGDLRVNGLTFPTGTPMQFRYGFDFYRLSYLYDFLPEVDQELALGLSLQLRVADLEFAALDGSMQRTSQNLGPVPLIKLRGRYTFDNDVFIGTEIDGIGIQFPSEQGSVLGLFFDTSLRVGYSPTKFLETFVNVRYLGGGARGPGSEPLSSEFGDGYNNNFIHALNFSVGFAVK